MPNTVRAITCPSCQAFNKPFAAFCEQCRTPLGATATLDPMNVIQAEGHLFRRALEGRPKLIVLLGVWVIFFPTLAVSGFSAVSLIIVRRGPSDFVFFWVSIGLAFLSALILYRITLNYLTLPLRRADPDEEAKE